MGINVPIIKGKGVGGEIVSEINNNNRADGPGAGNLTANSPRADLPSSPEAHPDPVSGNHEEERIPEEPSTFELAPPRIVCDGTRSKRGAEAAGPGRLEGYVKPRQNEFMELIKTLVARDIGFGIESLISVAVEFEETRANLAGAQDILAGLFEEQIPLAIGESMGLSKSQSPLDRLIMDSAAATEADPSLLGSTSIPIRPFAIYITGDTCKYRITMWDWFDERPFFDRTYEVADLGEIDGEEISELSRSFKEYASANYPRELSFRTDSLKAKVNIDPILTPDPSAEWNLGRIDHARGSWAKMSRIFDAKIFARPLASDVDRHRDNLFYAGYSSSIVATPVVIDESIVARAGSGAMQIKGALDMVYLEFKPDWMDRGNALYEKIGDEPIVDRYGNIIIPQRMERSVPMGNGVFLVSFSHTGFLVVPRLPFDIAARGGSWTFGVDLSEVGLGNYPALAAVASPPLINTESVDSPYRLFSTIPPESVNADYVMFRVLSDEIERFETDMGFEPGERIKNLFFVPASHSNAYVSIANPDTIYVHDDRIPEFSDASMASMTMRHEAVHCLDHQFGLSKDTAIEGFFKDHKDEKAFFWTVNESSFWPVKSGGHSDDGSHELLASLVNSIYSPKWATRVAIMKCDMRRLYLDALVALRSSFVEKYPSVVDLLDVPFYEQLSKRIEILSSFPDGHEMNSEDARKIMQLVSES